MTDKTTKEIIEALEKKGLLDMAGKSGWPEGKIRMIRLEIAEKCCVGHRTVDNWAAGAVPGEQSLRLLVTFAERRGVL